ncbi:MAG: hypothetical protein GKR90_15595 [Pseudomonadales bacterium]|nr:hypothetical protein [Pseudomonadales bacterium]
MRTFYGIPWAPLTSIAMVSFAYLSILFTTLQFGLILSPIAFLIYRLTQADNVARWFASALLVFLGASLFLQVQSMPHGGFEQGSKAQLMDTEVRRAITDSRDRTLMMVGFLVLSAVLLHTPSSRKWCLSRS